MKFLRRVRLVVIPACLCALWVTPVLAQQQPPAGQPPKQQQPPATPATPPAPQQQQPARPGNPFETIPAEQPAQQPKPPATQTPTTQPAAPAQQQQPQQPQLEAPPAVGQPVANPSGQVIEGFEFRGARRVPQDTLKALILSKPGDIYNEETLRRDFMILWNTGRFDDITPRNRAGPHRRDRPFRTGGAPRDPLHRLSRRQVGNRE